MYDEDEDLDDPEVVAYEAVLDDPDWHRTRKLAIEGTVFRHQKHAATVDPGVQHKLFVWICEAHRPAAGCPCGLYALQWLDSTRID